MEIDFLVLAIWMFGNREIVSNHFKKFKGEKIIIREGGDDMLSKDECLATWRSYA